MNTLKFSCALLVLCALAQSQSVKIRGRSRKGAALPISADNVDEMEEPAIEGRVFSVIRDSDRDRYHDDRPIIIQQPHQPSYPQYPQFPQPYPQSYPQAYPQPIPYPVPVPHHHHSERPTIIKPIIKPIYRPYPRPGWGGGYGDYGYGGGYGGGFGGGFGGYRGLPFINITYAPVLPALVEGRTLSDQEQLKGLAELSNQLLAQALPGQAQQSPGRHALQPNQLIYQQQQDPQPFYAQSTDGQLFALYVDQQQLLQSQQQQQQLAEFDATQKKAKKTQYVVRRTHKTKKNKKKKQSQLVYLPVEPEAESVAQSSLLEQIE